MPTGAYDAQDIWQYGEDDPASPFSDTLNLLAESTSDGFAADRARLQALEAGGARVSWAPALLDVTVGNGTLVGHYARIGDIVTYSWRLTFGTTTSFGVNVRFVLPFPSVQGSWGSVGNGFASRGTASATRTLFVARLSNTTDSNMWCDAGGMTSTPPFAASWAADDVVSMGGSYVAA